MGRGLGEILGGAQTANKQAQEARRAAEQQAAEEIKELQRQILAGESSSGNLLHDGIIALYGSYVNPEIVSNYEQIAIRLETADLYEPVVLIKNWLEDAEHLGIGANRAPRQSICSYLKMGTIKEKHLKFDLEQKEVYIPTAQIAFEKDWRGDLGVKNGDLLVDDPGKYGFMRYPSLGWQLNNPLDLNVPLMMPPLEDGPILELEILIGRDNINEWLSERGDFSMDRNRELRQMRKMAEILQIKTFEPQTREQRRYMGHRN